MATSPICEMSNFKPGKYFEQHELNSSGPIIYDYEYTRSLVIFASSRSAPGKLKDLTISISSYLEAQAGIGSKKVPGSTWQEKLNEVLLSQPFIRRGTSLDFSVSAASRVILLLAGGFWRFSNTMEALTTKFDFGSQYFDLQRHVVDPNGNVVPAGPNDDCRCISFFTDVPCHKSLSVRHAFSLNIELLMGPLVLPLTVDPDIENKGGP